MFVNALRMHSVGRVGFTMGLVRLSTVSLALILSVSVSAQVDRSAVVQPGAPGQPTKTLPPGTYAKLPPTAGKDAEFMQGMIMHHAQAVEMTAMIESRTTNREIRLLGARISQSQSDEMKFMKSWLQKRGLPTGMRMAASSSGHDHHGLLADERCR